MVDASDTDACSRLAVDNNASFEHPNASRPWTPSQDPLTMDVSTPGREMGKFPTKKLSVVDLFAGCGGFALGLEQSGLFAPAYVNELNDDARNNYLFNQKPDYWWLHKPEYHSSDVNVLARKPGLTSLQNALSAIGIQRPDLLVGGPPCQGFSGIGHRRSYKVEKEELPSNFLYKKMIKVIRGLQPRAFIFENVRGVLTGRWNAADEPRSIWRSLSKAFLDLEREGYRVAADLLHAKHYGVPQNRPRLLIVGIHEDVFRAGVPERTRSKNAELPLDALDRRFLPRSGHRKLHNLDELLGDLDFPNYKEGPSTRYQGDPSEIQMQFRSRGDFVLGDQAELFNQEYSKHSEPVEQRFLKMQEYAGKGAPLPPSDRTKKFAQRVLRARWEGKEPDFTVTSLPDDYVHYDKPRTLTVREWARLQTFPDWYRFKFGPRTTGGLRRAGNPLLGIYERELPHYTQIGNAVPVWLAEAVGIHLGRILHEGTLPR